MSKQEKQIEDALNTLRKYGYFVQGLWAKPDLDTICEEEGMEQFTDEQAIEFFEYFARKIDANVGINWHTLRAAVLEYSEIKAE